MQSILPEQSYLTGPISSKEWHRFEHYARFIHDLRCELEHQALDTSVFFYLSEHAQGRPLFPNLNKLTFDARNAAYELLSIITPSIRILQISCACRCLEQHGYDTLRYRQQCYAFKMLLPDVVRRLPVLCELKLPELGHKAFWSALSPQPDGRFISQTVRRLDIQIECPFGELLEAAISAISTISGLADLTLTSGVRKDVDEEMEMPDGWRADAITAEFPCLRRLEIHGDMPAIVSLTSAVVAPMLEDVALVRNVDDIVLADSYLPVLALDVLCSRSATSLRDLYFELKVCARFAAYWDYDSLSSSGVGLAKPLLRCRRLRKMDIFFQYSYADLYEDGVVGVFDPVMLESWPELETAELVNVALPPALFCAIARGICPRLKCVTGYALSDEFLDLALDTLRTEEGNLGRKDPVSGAVRSYDLQTLGVTSPLGVHSAAAMEKIRRFMEELFPNIMANPRNSLSYFCELKQ